MKYTAWVLLLLILGCSSSPPAPVAPLQPVFGWQVTETETLGLGPLIGVFQPVKSSGRVRLTVRAEGPLSFAIGSAEQMPDLVTAARVSTTLPCSAQNVIEKSLECKIPRSARLFMADDRPTSAQLAGAMLTKSGDAAINATNAQRVTLEISRWQCIANCAPSTK